MTGPITVPCLSCGARMEMDDVQLQAAWMTQPEGFYCGDCSAQLAAAPSSADWIDTAWERGGRLSCRGARIGSKRTS
jgi:hypothetical protein